MQIHGVKLIDHLPNPDRRGSLTTVVRESDAGPLRQWNLVRSDPNVLRGLHAHLAYDEVYVPINGNMFFLLKDARPASPTFGAELPLWSRDIPGKSIFVPRGVAHGVYFADAGILLYALSNPWTGDGELECRWNDPAVTSPWPSRDPILSERDAAAGSFAAMASALKP